MASLNQCNFIGNLGSEPDLKYTASGNAIANISIACTETWRDKESGDKKESVEWVRIVFFGRLAEIVGEWLHKGSQVYVSGRMQTKKYTDKEGAVKYSTSIIATEMKMLGSKDNKAAQPSGQGGFRDNPETGKGLEDDRIPF